jgi:DNA (cytosine-5)-methyltransferase 1
MKYGSVCSGVEAATVAWHDLGFEPQWFSEIDAFPSAVLQHHYPTIPNHGDMTKFKEWNTDEQTIDLLVGGTPCQSFSVAGLRQGLEDPRGNLMLTYLAMAEQLKPKWLVWENVPGVLSSNQGRDFATFLTAMGKIGYGFAYRVLDAQYFGVPQRRRRVFVVGCLGDWRSAASVLFESESLSGHPAPSRETRQRVAPTVGTGAPYSRTGNARVEADALVFGAQNSASQGASVSKDISPTLDTSKVPALTISERSLALTVGNEIASTLTATDYKGVQAVTYALPGNWIGRKPENGGNQVEPFVELSPCQTATDVHAVVASRMRGFGDYIQDETASTIKARDHKDATDLVATGSPTIRRMTPRECERLQGFPDDYTQISWRGKEPEDCPNGHRYKAMGNSMAVPVMKWIGERIQQVEKEPKDVRRG